jgi:hypothetical protein
MTEWGIDTLFNPGKRHMDEEKRRLQSTREEIGDSSGGRRIDLDSGTVTISRRPANPAAGEQDESTETAEDQAADDEAADVEATDEAVAADEAAAEADRSASQE